MGIILVLFLHDPFGILVLAQYIGGAHRVEASSELDGLDGKRVQSLVFGLMSWSDVMFREHFTIRSVVRSQYQLGIQTR